MSFSECAKLRRTCRQWSRVGRRVLGNAPSLIESALKVMHAFGNLAHPPACTCCSRGGNTEFTVLWGSLEVPLTFCPPTCMTVGQIECLTLLDDVPQPGMFVRGLISAMQIFVNSPENRYDLSMRYRVRIDNEFLARKYGEHCRPDLVRVHEGIFVMYKDVDRQKDAPTVRATVSSSLLPPAKRVQAVWRPIVPVHPRAAAKLRELRNRKLIR